jgi:hypothetical protein
VNQDKVQSNFEKLEADAPNFLRLMRSIQPDPVGRHALYSVLAHVVWSPRDYFISKEVHALCLTGPAGSGKSTLLAVLRGFNPEVDHLCFESCKYNDPSRRGRCEGVIEFHDRTCHCRHLLMFHGFEPASRLLLSGKKVLEVNFGRSTAPEERDPRLVLKILQDERNQVLLLLNYARKHVPEPIQSFQLVVTSV